MIRAGISCVFQRFRKSETGTSLVEFSLLLPVLIAMMGGAIEFGRAFQQHHIANKGVTSAARYLARVLNNDLCPTPTGTIWTDSIANAQILAQRGTFDASTPYLIPGWNSGSTFTASVTCVNNPIDGGTGISTYRGPNPQPVITVTTTFPYNGIGMLGVLKILPGGPDMNDGDLTITASHDELYIGG